MNYKKFLSFFSVIFLFSSTVYSEVNMDRLTNAMSEPENWLTHHKSLDGARYVELNQINRFNVQNMKVAYTIPLGDIAEGSDGLGSHQSTPLVKDGFMYVTGLWDVVYKIDLTGKYPSIVWTFDPENDVDVRGIIRDSRISTFHFRSNSNSDASFASFEVEVNQHKKRERDFSKKDVKGIDITA